MDIDGADKQEEKPVKKAKVAAAQASASAESAAPYPDMALAQDIHRLTMIHAGKLSVDDATSITGTKPEDLLERVMLRVGAGFSKPFDDVIKENEEKYKAIEKEEGKDVSKVEAKEKEEQVDDSEEPLLNPELYRHLQSTLAYNSSSALSEDQLKTLAAHNESILAILTEGVTKAKEEAGDMEVLHATMEIARYQAKTGTKESALAAYENVLALPKLSVGKKLDGHLEMARVCSFWGDWRQMKDVLEKAQKIIASGGDWDRRNRLKAYQSLSNILVREFEPASKLLLGGIATFSCTELCEYPEYIMYAIITNLLFLKRTELKKNIIDGSEVLQVAKEIPVVLKLANTLYECDYKAYLHTIVDLQPHLVANRYLQPHSGYILRELHVLAFQQFLDSYQSVTLDSMAASFGVGTEFLDMQLSRFIAAGRLTAKIDKYGGVVETNRPDWKNARYQEMIQKGDLLLNRIQKLGRVVDL